MATICPTVTAEDTHTYRNQIERLEEFASRIHLDFMDGLFTKNKSIELENAWMPKRAQVDLHLMYMRPDIYIDQIVIFAPSLVIVHAEAKGNYHEFAKKLQEAGIKRGVCLLQDTPIAAVTDSLDSIDHILIFSGDLGHFGGTVDLSLLEKVRQLKEIKPNLEIGWDGGVNDSNARSLIDGGVDVLNVGGFIQKAEDPRRQFDTLVAAAN